MIEREGNLTATVMENTGSATLLSIISENIKDGSTLYTDEWTAYNGISKIDNGFTHEKVIHNAKEYVNDKAHTNSVECFWSHLKRGVGGIYHWCSVKHLQAYVDEYALRYNTRKIKTDSRFNLVLQNCEGRLTYKSLITNN